MPTKIDSVITRQRVDDLEAAIPFYERLTGQTAGRFGFAGVQLASVGPFLLFCGPDEAVQRVAGVNATLAVADMAAAVEEAVAAGATVVMPGNPPPTGSERCCGTLTGACTNTSAPERSQLGSLQTSHTYVTWPGR